MENLKENLKSTLKYIQAFVKWFTVSVVIGAVGGTIGSIFHICIDYVTETRVENPFLIYFLPVGGLFTALIYHFLSQKERLDTNRVLEALQKEKKVPFVLAPLIFVSTLVTHLLGGSAGREGAALQLGGSIGSTLGKTARLNPKDMRAVIMTGMSAVFAALFGTPVTAAIFAIEVSTVGIMCYEAILPCVLSAVTASSIAAKVFSLKAVEFSFIKLNGISVELVLKTIVFSLLCAVISILFCNAIKLCERAIKKITKNTYYRALVGGCILVLITLLAGTYDYNGAGMDVVEKAMQGEANPEAFLLKILFTAITIAAGFKGGEIVPAFFVGSTFGCVMGPLLGMDASLTAALGFVALFCGVINCPVASLVLSVEVFGGEGILLFAIACGICYVMSGNYGLYKSQKFLRSKINEDDSEEIKQIIVKE